MTLKKLSGAGLLRSRSGFCSCLFLSVAHDVAYAQAQAPAAAPAAAPARRRRRRRPALRSGSEEGGP